MDGRRLAHWIFLALLGWIGTSEDFVFASRRRGQSQTTKKDSVETKVEPKNVQQGAQGKGTNDQRKEPASKRDSSSSSMAEAGETDTMFEDLGSIKTSQKPEDAVAILNEIHELMNQYVKKNMTIGESLSTIVERVAWIYYHRADESNFNAYNGIKNPDPLSEVGGDFFGVGQGYFRYGGLSSNLVLEAQKNLYQLLYIGRLCEFFWNVRSLLAEIDRLHPEIQQRWEKLMHKGNTASTMLLVKKNRELLDEIEQLKERIRLLELKIEKLSYENTKLQKENQELLKQNANQPGRNGNVWRDDGNSYDKYSDGEDSSNTYDENNEYEYEGSEVENGSDAYDENNEYEYEGSEVEDDAEPNGVGDGRKFDFDGTGFPKVEVNSRPEKETKQQSKRRQR